MGNLGELMLKLLIWTGESQQNLSEYTGNWVTKIAALYVCFQFRKGVLQLNSGLNNTLYQQL